MNTLSFLHLNSILQKFNSFYDPKKKIMKNIEEDREVDRIIICVNL